MFLLRKNEHNMPLWAKQKLQSKPSSSEKERKKLYIVKHNNKNAVNLVNISMKTLFHFQNMGHCLSYNDAHNLNSLTTNTFRFFQDLVASPQGSNYLNLFR